MARRPGRSAKRPAPRTARTARRPPPPAVAAVGNDKPGLRSLARRLSRESPAARDARQQRTREAVTAVAAEIRQRVDDGHALWRVLTGEPMPLELDDIRAAAARFGLSADAVLAGEFTLADVTTLMVGKRRAADDAVRDRMRAAKAEAAVRGTAGTVTPSAPTPGGARPEAVDDEYAWATEHFARTDWRILEVCVEQGFIDRASAQPTHRITQFVAGTGGRPAKGECGDLRRHFDFLSARGFLTCRRGVGTFATQKAVAVCKARDAERTSAVRMVSQE